jgi:hypothetical protein
MILGPFAILTNLVLDPLVYTINDLSVIGVVGVVGILGVVGVGVYHK